jgi:amino acid transporter
MLAAWNQGSLLGVGMMIALSVLFNPFAPLLLEKPYWTAAILFASVVFFLAANRLSQEVKTPIDESTTGLK